MEKKMLLQDADVLNGDEPSQTLKWKKRPDSVYRGRANFIITCTVAASLLFALFCLFYFVWLEHTKYSKNLTLWPWKEENVPTQTSRGSFYHQVVEEGQSRHWFVKEMKFDIFAKPKKESKKGKSYLMDPQCDIGGDKDRFDCFPDPNPTETKCIARGCCWKPPTDSHAKSASVPNCFFPKDYPNYFVTSLRETTFGYTAMLRRTGASAWPNDVQQLQLDIYFETKERLHFKIYDPKNKRYEVPIKTPKVTVQALVVDYSFHVRQSPFGITINRTSTGQILFDTAGITAPLIFADQFIQVSTVLANNFLYGLGERRGSYQQNTSWHDIALWAKDVHPVPNSNLYGVHPFHLAVEPSGLAHGVFLLNSNAMDLQLQPTPALTYRTIGGILDFYIFLGKTPDEVIMQYSDVIGHAFMPPFWSLGFHLCRWGYGSADKMKEVIDRNRAAKIPYDTQWNDIDYMQNNLDWTYDTQKFKALPDIVKDLQANGQHYIILVDPGISNAQPAGSYPPFDEGLRQAVFIKNSTGHPMIGKVWPGTTAFPDFTNPVTAFYWYECAKTHHDTIPFDGMWIDMNKPTSFLPGSVDGCPASPLDNPPYTPGINGGKLDQTSLCSSAQQFLSSHYNLHSLYGYFHAVASYSIMRKIKGKRSIIMSRSTYPGSGQFTGHWLGDNKARWEDMHYSIAAILNFQMFGISLVGADVCGFAEDSNEELCTRWMQLGAFYPFMRNQNEINTTDQDPGVFSTAAQDIMRSALELRYSLLPYLYTLFYSSHVSGTLVARPLLFQYPLDKNTYAIDRQFMWGSALLISPCLEQAKTTVHAYLPKDTWYNISSGEPTVSQGEWVDLPAPLDTINVHVRGGSIIPRLYPNITTTLMRGQPFYLYVALAFDGSATGQLFWDDGETLDPIETDMYSLINFQASGSNTLTGTVVHSGYMPPQRLLLNMIRVFGVNKRPSNVTINRIPNSFMYYQDTKVLEVYDFVIDLLQPLICKW